jgi:hypothetical protein
MNSFLAAIVDAGAHAGPRAPRPEAPWSREVARAGRSATASEAPVAGGDDAQQPLALSSIEVNQPSPFFIADQDAVPCGVPRQWRKTCNGR